MTIGVELVNFGSFLRMYGMMLTVESPPAGYIDGALHILHVSDHFKDCVVRSACGHIGPVTTVRRRQRWPWWHDPLELYKANGKKEGYWKWCRPRRLTYGAFLKNDRAATQTFEQTLCRQMERGTSSCSQECVRSNENR